MNLSPYNFIFPTEALPPSMAKAVSDVHHLTLAPPALIASSCIAAASLATQNLFDVERREGLVGPTGLLFVTICGSGERKTTVDGLFTRAIREFDQKNDLDYESRLRDYAADLAVWQIMKKAAEQELRRAIKEGAQTETPSQSLALLVKQMPVPPINAPLLLSDATPAAIKNALRKEMSAIGIFADEASAVFDGKALSEFALINELWDGGTIHVDRVGAGRWTIKDARLTMSLMVQPDVFDTFLQRRGKAARNIGLLARILIAYPISTLGFRPLKDTPRQEHLGHFNDRVKALLEKAQERRLTNPGPRPRLRFDGEAQWRWNELFNEVETAAGPYGNLADIKDHAAKYADNLARLAAVFHAFEGDSGDISLDTLNRAIEITQWFGNSFKHFFSPPPPAAPPFNPFPVDQDAELIKRWLAKQYTSKGDTEVLKERLERCGPPRTRPVHRLHPALDRLAEWQVIHPKSDLSPNKIILHRLFIEHIRQHNTATGYNSRQLI